MDRDQIVCELWVCQCCTLCHANGECCADDEHGGDSRVPWSEIDFAAGYSVTMGMLAEEHSEDCTEEIRREVGCDCEQREFSTSQCEGCGSWLHGYRHAFTLWRDTARQTVS